MKKLLLLVFLPTLFCQTIFAQKEAWNWYFGDFAAVNFSTGSPVSLNNSALSSNHGSASVSDANGNLLFYTNGQFVFDKTHLPMLNGYGLLGDVNSTQSALIVKKPLSTSLYYIFTMDDATGTNGLNYSVVDMTLNSGNGDVTLKNVPVRANAREKLTAIKNANGIDYWIVMIDWASDFIYAYPFNNNGLDTVPVVSPATALQMQQGGTFSSRRADGYMKANRQGNRIAMALYGSDSYDLLNFNNSTGIASNHITIQGTDLDMYHTYGVEFSPDGTKLYGSTGGYNSSSFLYQFDLNAGSPQQIYNSKVMIGGVFGTSQDYISALQIAPNGKIYCSLNAYAQLGVISFPDSLGPACDYNLGPMLSGNSCFYGLPNFPADYAFPVPVGIKQLENNIAIDVYPNPASDYIIITIETPNFVNSICSVENILGESLNEIQIQNTTTRINLSMLPPGLYNLHFKINDKAYYRKFIISR